MVVNPSFEANVFTGYPGYVNTAGNGTISGWTSNNTNSGLNPFNGTGIYGNSPFTDNGVIPDGNQAAFLQSSSGLVTTLSQNLSGFMAGHQYEVSFYDNSRTYSQSPLLNVLLGGQSIFTNTITPVDPTGVHKTAYHFDSGIYTASTSGSESLMFFSTSAGDATALIDKVSVRDLGPASAAPEPSQIGILALVAISLGALAVKARKRSAASQTA